MPEISPVQYRSEHSRSAEDAETYQAIETLVELGRFIRVNDLDLYHGRAAVAGEPEWQVDPSFQNGGNANGNNNINARPTLYAASEDIATEYARVRKKRALRAGASPQDVRAELHTVVSSDPDAVIINNRFDNSTFTAEETDRYHQALRTLLPQIVEGAPVKFKDRHMSPAVIKDAYGQRDKSKLEGRLTEVDAAAIAARHGLTPDSISDQIAAINTCTALQTNMSRAVNVYLNSVDPIIQEPGMPSGTLINMDYMGRFMRAAHIVGVRAAVSSPNVNRNFEAISIFDLDKVNASHVAEHQRDQMANEFGRLAAAVEAMPLPTHKVLAQRLGDAHAKPQALVGAAISVPDWGDTFQAKTGVWEGYTLEQHVQVALQNFDENFADKVPVPLLAPLRLAIMAMNVGRPAKRDAAAAQEEFLQAAGVSPAMKAFVEVLNNKAVPLARSIVLKGETENKDQLDGVAALYLRLVTGRRGTQDGLAGFKKLCEIMLTVDGGVYTSMAHSRASGAAALAFMHQGSFDASFERSRGTSGRNLRLRHADRLY